MAANAFPIMIDVLIHSPFPRQSSQGNSVTADRLDAILRKEGFWVLMETEAYQGADARCLIALNARKSAQAIADYQDRNQDSRVVVILTGTDINHPDARAMGSPTWKSLETADSLVLLHDASLAAVPKEFHDKCVVIHPSVTLPEGLEHTPDDQDFAIVIAGNSRVEKNPALAIHASRMISEVLNIHVYGDFSEHDPSRLIKHGIVPHQEMLVAMSRARLLLNTSIQEGGANAICEAVSMGLPVIASAIPGNIGILGEDYAGLFPSDNLTALVQILEKSAKDSAFYGLLKEQVTARTPLFSYEREAGKWAKLLCVLLK